MTDLVNEIHQWTAYKGAALSIEWFNHCESLWFTETYLVNFPYFHAILFSLFNEITEFWLVSTLLFVFITFYRF